MLVYRNLLLVLAVQKLFLTDESELSAVVRGSLVVPCVTSLLFPGLFPLAGGTGGAEPSRAEPPPLCFACGQSTVLKLQSGDLGSRAEVRRRSIS